jgi:hypothetical protein
VTGKHGRIWDWLSVRVEAVRGVNCLPVKLAGRLPALRGGALHSGNSGENGAGGGDVEGDLFLEGVEGGEGLFGADFLDKNDFEFPAVKVALEVEKVEFQVELGFGVLAGGAETEVENGAVEIAAGQDMGGVNAVGREDEIGDVEIGRGEAEFASELIAGDDGAGKGVGASEHLTGEMEPALLDGSADAGAADDFAVERDRGEAVNDKLEFGSEFLEEGDVPGAFVPEGKAAADTNAMDVREVTGEVADEVVGLNPAERKVEMKKQDGIDPEGINDAKFLREGIDEGRRAMGSDDFGGVPVEGDDDGAAVVLSGVGYGLADDLLVAEMDAIEHTDGEGNAARFRGKFSWVADNQLVN